MSKNVTVQIEGRELSLSNLDKVLYPEAGFTKAQVIDYYTRIAPVMLPHLRDHPLTEKRYPDGVNGQFFFEKNCPSFRPEWLQIAPVWSGSTSATVNYCLAQDLASLVWLANLAAIELHPNLGTASEIGRPSWLVFDLDPGAPAAMTECCKVGLVLRELFSRLSMQAFAKTSGSKGLQVYVPLNTPVTYDQTKPFARNIALALETRPDLGVVSSMKKSLRPGKVLVDWSQNDEHKTTVSVYSLRAKPQPTVSTPVTWDEVEAASRGEPLSFTSEEVLRRVQRHGDLFAPVLELKQELPALQG